MSNPFSRWKVNDLHHGARPGRDQIFIEMTDIKESVTDKRAINVLTSNNESFGIEDMDGNEVTLCLFPLQLGRLAMITRRLLDLDILLDDNAEDPVEQMWKVCAEIGFQLFHALGSQLHGLGGRHVLAVCGAKAQKLFINTAAQRALHRARGQKAHPARTGGAYAPHKDSCQPRGQRQCKRAGGGGALQQLLQKPRAGEDHPCIAQQGKPLKRHVSGDVRFAVRHGADQPFVDHHGQTPFGRLVKTNLR